MGGGAFHWSNDCWRINFGSRNLGLWRVVQLDRGSFSVGALGGWTAARCPAAATRVTTLAFRRFAQRPLTAWAAHAWCALVPQNIAWFGMLWSRWVYVLHWLITSRFTGRDLTWNILIIRDSEILDEAFRIPSLGISWILTCDLLPWSSSAFCSLNCLSKPPRLSTCSFSSFMPGLSSKEWTSFSCDWYLKERAGKGSNEKVECHKYKLQPRKRTLQSLHEENQIRRLLLTLSFLPSAPPVLPLALHSPQPF